MEWIAPYQKDETTSALEDRLWKTADQMRANSGLTAAQYSGPVLGLIFLRFADVRFQAMKKELEKEGGSSRRRSPADDPQAYIAKGIMYLPESARFETLLNLPEGTDLGKAVNEAMSAVEKENESLRGILPQGYQNYENATLAELLKMVSSIPEDMSGDAIGKVYEYFLSSFAMAEGQLGGEFYTPTSIVQLMVEILEPYHGLILDPACGSGGMFVQSARFVSRHKKNPSKEISIYGQELKDLAIPIARMNLAVHGLEGDIRKENSYYDDLHKSTGRFDYVLANPPFNVNAVDKERLKTEVGKGKRYPLGLPRTDNGNYLWIQMFYSALNKKGRAGFVMANSASDARSSEMELRKTLIEDSAVDVMVAVGPNMFYTVTLPCTLWFLDKAKRALPPSPRSPLPGGDGQMEGLSPSPRSPLPTGDGKKTKYRGGFDFASLKERARELRKKNTDAESFLWELLRNKNLAGLKFRRQHQFGEYIADFYCHELGLVLELDGSVHSKADQKKHDKKRDSYLESQGLTVIRFGNAEALEQPEKILEKVLKVKADSTMTNDSGIVRGCDTVLFLDARHIYRQIDRAHRDWTEGQIGFLANVVRLYRGEKPDYSLGGKEAEEKMKEIFGKKPAYADVAGLCKVATVSEIAEQGYSLNPGRYVGVAAGEEMDEDDFKQRFAALHSEFEELTKEAHGLEKLISKNAKEILG
ncbi:MAG: N-6 DNA methylase [Leptospiraceae bacterium]